MKKLGDILKEEGLITEELLELALKEQKRTGELLGEVLLRLGFVSEEELLRALSKQAGKEEEEIEVDEELVTKVPKDVALRWKFIPVKKEGEKIVIASPSNHSLELKSFVERFFKAPVEIKPLSETEFDKLFRLYYGEKINIEALVDDILKRLQGGANVGSDTAIINIVNHILNKGLDDNATDIHIEPGESVTRIRYRVDGVLKVGLVLPKKIHNSIIIRLKVLAGLDISESRIPQDGAFTFKYGNREVDVRTSILPSIYGEAAVLRLLNVTGELPELPKLGFSEEDLKKVEMVGKQPYGIILASGPTGSGKTTTLYALLNTVFSLKKCIISVEDPPEIKWELIRQVRVNPRAGLTFSSALRSILRQDPDIVLIGEIRDPETADIAVKAAQTGHLILSTVHTNTATEVPLRLQNLNVDPYLFAPVLLGVIGQRLVRKICPYCKAPYPASEREKEILGVPPDKELTLWKGLKCNRCKFTGYMGRTVIAEVFIPDAEIQEEIVKGISAIKLRKLAIEKGMKTMYMDAVNKILRGITTVEELERVLKTTERF